MLNCLIAVNTLKNTESCAYTSFFVLIHIDQQLPYHYPLKTKPEKLKQKCKAGDHLFMYLVFYTCYVQDVFSCTLWKIKR